MAREMYLAGIDPEELKPREPSPPPPMTPRGKLANFWYHRKWWVILGAAAVFTLGLLLYQSFTKVAPDYLICLVTEKPMTVDARRYLEERWTALADDRNGDGTVKVVVQVLNVGTAEGGAVQTANRQAVTGHLVADDVELYAFAPHYYNETVLPALTDGSRLFAALPFSGSGISEDGTFWNWNGTGLQQHPEYGAQYSYDLYFGVRVPRDASSSKQNARKQAAETLLQAIADQAAEAVR